MREPLKDMYNKDFLRSFAERVQSVYEDFNIEGFIATAMDETWEGLKLKARMRRITET